MVIYKITNPIGEIYIGKSTNVEKRWETYKYPGDILQTKFYKSLRKYGFENHHKEVIEENIDESLGGDREIYYIDVYNSYHNGLNMNPGGGGVGKHKPETKKLISEARKGWIPSVERGIKIGNKNRGKPCSEERKQKISQALKGKPKVFKGRVSPNLGNKYSDEVREEISKRRKEWGYSEETKQKMRDSAPKVKVKQYTKEGEFIKTWDSITQAKNEVGGDISHCVNGKQKTAGGYIWKKDNIRIDKYTKTNNIMSNNGEKKLTSVKIDPELWDLFKIECIKRKFSFQKLSERAIDLYMKDEDFRRKVTNHSV